MSDAKYLVFIMALFLIFEGCATTTPYPPRAPGSAQDQSATTTVVSTASMPGALPDVIRLDQTFFVTYYNKTLRLPEFSEYTLTADHLRRGTAKRKNRFHADAALISLGLDPVKPQDYRGSGYDRGHMAPSGDIRWSAEANDATFVMSNMAPQKPGLNRQAWEALENKVRQWACAAGTLKVITGPVLTGALSKLSTDVVVPQKFYKIIVDEVAPIKAIGFVMSQDDTDRDTFKTNHVPIKTIEALTGIDFVSEIAEADRTKIENDDDLTEWKEADCTPPREKGAATKPAAHKPEDTPARPHGNTCSAGTLKSATISGCCQGHQGVMGPKHLRACCNESNQVLCNDGSPDNSCTCNE